jgi:hypothetical protein
LVGGSTFYFVYHIMRAFGGPKLSPNFKEAHACAAQAQYDHSERYLRFQIKHQHNMNIFLAQARIFDAKA